MQNIETENFEGLPCYIIGKGKSLLDIKDNFIDGAPIIAINQAVEIIEKLNLKNPVYSLQKVKVSETKYPIITDSMGLDKTCFSALVAIKLAQHWGCPFSYMLAFDACTKGDLRPVENGKLSDCGITDYASACEEIYKLVEKDNYKLIWI